MKNETYNKLISQIKKYDLTSYFKSFDKLNQWITKLNKRQINNLLNLKIDINKLDNFKYIIINNDLLNTKDYIERINQISTLNKYGDIYLFEALNNSKFLNSKNFYKDIEIINKEKCKYGLWILGNDNFIKSKYHFDDLNIIIKNNINNKDESLSYLACNKESLKDKNHLKNMQLLATNPISKEFLLEIMTNKKYIKGKYYQEEINILYNAKNKIKARALYYYIVNPDRKFLCDVEYCDDYKRDEYDIHISYNNCVNCNKEYNYIENLFKLAEYEDRFIMYYTSLFLNYNFINSKYKEYDLDLLETLNQKDIFVSFYQLIMNNNSIQSRHHKSDGITIIRTKDNKKRELLLKCATNKYNLNSINHRFDMEYITKLDIDSLDKETLDKIYYYLFNKVGIESQIHKEKLLLLSNKLLTNKIYTSKSKILINKNINSRNNYHYK